MQEKLGPASDAYNPENCSHHIQDEPVSDLYKRWGYTIGYEVNEANQPVPEGGNTAIFRIAPKGLTEPVFVTKPKEGATFTVEVLDGTGVFIRAKEGGTVDRVPLTKGVQVIVRPGEAYSYANTGDADLVLYDVAMPAFQPGDDAEMTASLLTGNRPAPKDGYSACVVEINNDIKVIELPNDFFEAMSQLMK